MIEWFVGFHRPSFRNAKGRIDPQCWFGHVEIWGYNKDDTWLFIDPQAKGTKIVMTHLYDDVMAHLEARHILCELILKLPAEPDTGLIPVHGPMTCATIVGHILGVRAFAPAGLRRKLLANGAEVVHGEAERRSSR